MLRTHTAGELRAGNVGETVSLCGWIASRRDHKGTIFVDLRDRYGLTQCVFRHGEGEDAVALEKGSELPLETCVRVTGEVSERPEGLRNPKLATGDVEVLVTNLEVLGEAATPPLEIVDDLEASDELRMRYRYLDLRRTPMREMIEARHRITMAIRRHLDERGFLEVETPLLTKSTPEGARDYLVPSRERKGSFYALPQSPQIFKQLLMVAGVDRYYQIARCFRDEDLRADRQPEFTQLDLEMSFVTEEDVLLVMEELTAELLREFTGAEPPRPYPRMSFGEAMTRYGTDRPDLRYGVEIADFTERLAGSEFRGFSETVAAGGKVRGLAAPGGAGLSRKEITALEDVARENGGKGLLWFKLGEEGATGPAAKFLSPEETEAVRTGLGAADGDLVLLAADRENVVAPALGAVRVAVAAKLGLVPEGRWEPLFVTDFPLTEWNEEEGRLDPLHHPFTSPRPEDEAKLATEPASVLARAYDLVLNGVELGGGSIRIHREELQRKVFAAIGLSEEDARQKFGFLLEALRYGAPPHGGFAFGLDRLVGLLVGREGIRDVIVFPKTTTAACPLTGAPSAVADGQLEELGLALRVPPAGAED
jgi:aspartyl-tRNA synthetase